MNGVMLDIILMLCWGTIGAYNIGVKSEKIRGYVDYAALHGLTTVRQQIIKDERAERLNYTILFIMVMLMLAERVASSISLM